MNRKMVLFWLPQKPHDRPRKGSKLGIPKSQRSHDTHKYSTVYVNINRPATSELQKVVYYMCVQYNFRNKDLRTASAN